MWYQNKTRTFFFCRISSLSSHIAFMIRKILGAKEVVYISNMATQRERD
jgi:hypothetical protein